MKKIAILTAAVLSVGALTFVSAAEEAKPQPATETKKEVPASQPATTQPGPIVNKKCPVGDEDVDPKGKTVAYKGKTVGFCCDECIEDFKKDPDKYAKKLDLK